MLLTCHLLSDPYEAVAGVQMTEWERQREQEEFSKAAKIYRPLSSMMASRFTRGAFIDDPDQPSGLVDTVVSAVVVFVLARLVDTVVSAVVVFVLARLVDTVVSAVVCFCFG